MDVNPNLGYLTCNNNQLNFIDGSSLSGLVWFYCNDNNLSTLNLNESKFLEVLNCNNNQLTHLFLKNNADESAFGVAMGASSLDFNGNPLLEYVCTDNMEAEFVAQRIIDYGYDSEANTYCTLIPGGDVTTLSVDSFYDFDLDGCEPSDIPYSFLKFSVTNDSFEGNYWTNANGNFNAGFLDGDYIVTPVMEHPEYFNVSPSNIAVSLNSANDVLEEFCITPNGTHNDVESYIIPLTDARPGFDAEYKVVFKNNGNTMLSGDVEFNFDGNFVDLVSTTPTHDFETENLVRWNYYNLMPFEIREVYVTVNINTPTDENYPVNGGDELGYQTVITPINSDVNDEDNIMSIKHIVVNSFDPNDKTCLEGSEILEEEVGSYVHYKIRFENTGTANAINIVVKDIVDETKFDISSFQPLSSSHDFETRIVDGNIIEFLFENIQLPFDDASNDGYVVFKIRTLSSLVLGDIFDNNAEIYFDYNAPIITNNYETVIVEENLGLDDFTTNTFEFYPNPANEIIRIESLNVIDAINIYSVQGQLVKRMRNFGNKYAVEVKIDNLIEGLYFVEMISGSNTSIQKMIKK